MILKKGAGVNLKLNQSNIKTFALESAMKKDDNVGKDDDNVDACRY